MIRFRPHHFFCALGFQGKGYSERFTANMDAIVNGQLRAEGGGDCQIKVIRGLDSICAPCPKRRNDQCAEQAKIEALDDAHAAAMSVSGGDVLSWAEAQTRMAALPAGIHQTICKGCQWLELGLCEAAHDALRHEKGRTR